jgi:hypothetical protein
VTFARATFALALAGVLLVAGGLVAGQHGHFAFEGWIGFQAGYGFAAAAAAALAARALASFLRRREDGDG